MENPFQEFIPQAAYKIIKDFRSKLKTLDNPSLEKDLSSFHEIIIGIEYLAILNTRLYTKLPARMNLSHAIYGKMDFDLIDYEKEKRDPLRHGLRFLCFVRSVLAVYSLVDNKNPNSLWTFCEKLEIPKEVYSDLKIIFYDLEPYKDEVLMDYQHSSKSYKYSHKLDLALTMIRSVFNKILNHYNMSPCFRERK